MTGTGYEMTLDSCYFQYSSDGKSRMGHSSRRRGTGAPSMAATSGGRPRARRPRNRDMLWTPAAPDRVVSLARVGSAPPLVTVVQLLPLAWWVPTLEIAHP